MQKHNTPIPYACLLFLIFSVPEATAIGFDSDDFLIAGVYSDNISVYDEDLNFKGELDSDFEFVSALDFDHNGNLVATGRGELRVYNSDGLQVSGFISPRLSVSIDMKVGPSGNYYTGGQTLEGLRKFAPDGTALDQIATGDYEGVAVLPGGVLWGGGAIPAPTGFLNAFTLDSGSLLGPIPFDNGQRKAHAMHYSRATGTVLISDPDGDAIFERATDGTFIRKFSDPGFGFARGVTRGPDGDVFATQSNNRIFRWKADGTFVGFTPLSSTIEQVGNIVWAGNIIPEPSSLLLVLLGSLSMFFYRHAVGR